MQHPPKVTARKIAGRVKPKSVYHCPLWNGERSRQCSYITSSRDALAEHIWGFHNAEEIARG